MNFVIVVYSCIFNYIMQFTTLGQPIGSSDFSWESWTFSDTNNNQDDFSLNSFAMWREDAYIKPMLDEALNVDKGRIKIFASPWSTHHLFLLNNICHNVISTKK